MEEDFAKTFLLLTFIKEIICVNIASLACRDIIPTVSCTPEYHTELSLAFQLICTNVQPGLQRISGPRNGDQMKNHSMPQSPNTANLQSSTALPLAPFLVYRLVFCFSPVSSMWLSQTLLPRATLQRLWKGIDFTDVTLACGQTIP